jgi:putative DNA primase/helicase
MNATSPIDVLFNGAAEARADDEARQAGVPSAEAPHLTDRGNALRLVERHGKDLLHVFPWKKWLAWDGKRWRIDDSGEAMRRAKDVISALYRESAARMKQIAKELEEASEDTIISSDDGDGDGDKRAKLKRQFQYAEKLLAWALKSESAQRLSAILDLARSDLPADVSKLDMDPMLLNVANGTLDLRTNTLRPHRREDLITTLCPVTYDPKAACPTWIKFLDTVFASKAKLIEFIKRLVGLFLTGDVSEPLLLVLYGVGANGKSVFINVLLELLGHDYGWKTPAEMLMLSGERHLTERAALFKKRLVAASEFPQGRKLNEALIKDLTGGEPITARRMFENLWSFFPTHKMLVASNYRPEILGGDDGIWRRVRLIPFDVQFWDPDDLQNVNERDQKLRQDKKLIRKLRQELPGILIWALSGCQAWQKDGLTLPDEVKAATSEYRHAEDRLGQFIAECCLTGNNNYRSQASRIYASFRKWCEAAGQRPPSQTSFGEALPRIPGITKAKDSRGLIGYVGVAVRDPVPMGQPEGTEG